MPIVAFGELRSWSPTLGPLKWVWKPDTLGTEGLLKGGRVLEAPEAGHGLSMGHPRLVAVDSVFDEGLKGDVFKGPLMGGGQNNEGCHTSLMCFSPPGCTQAPPISRLKAWEAISRHGGHQVIAHVSGESKERIGHDSADNMCTSIIGTCFAAAIAIEASHGVGGAALQLFAEHVSGGHHNPQTTKEFTKGRWYHP